MLDGAHPAVHGERDDLGRVGVGANVAAEGLRFLDSCAHLAGAVLQAVCLFAGIGLNIALSPASCLYEAHYMFFICSSRIVTTRLTVPPSPQHYRDRWTAPWQRPA